MLVGDDTPMLAYFGTSKSSSISRASGEFLVGISTTALAFPSPEMADSQGLPIHHSVSDVVTKKEMALYGKPPAQKAVHLIPLVLIFCGFVLWIFSHQ
ncbi:unnamed protein product [Sphenostylis stenocarpa]|uniref:Uncharacterized protein n=1 Tax=Sphenostylis stenocarpa TaxID=92480 RepID=A0AA86SZH0_9FABA|nr:unnamed protein product [Sphenostylis stenocarpa]